MPQQRKRTSDLLEHPWSCSVEETLQDLEVKAEQGLADKEVRRRRNIYGNNRLKRIKARSAWRILIEQFTSLVIALLGVAALAAAIFGRWVESIAIAVALLINALIGFFTELNATRSMEALHRLGSSEATVRREGHSSSLPAEELVPGDVVVLEAGDLVPADLRLIEANDIQADEAALTGESLPITKQIEPLPKDTPLAERSAMLYKGTSVTGGSGLGVVVAIGEATQVGKIATLSKSVSDEFTPLEKRLEQLGKRLVWATLAVGVLVAVAGLIGGKDWLLVLETALAMAVAAVPEGLPIVATIALARGMWRMVRHNALINRLSAVETLGATTIICTDKTGTLTENRMRLQSLEQETGSVELEQHQEKGKDKDSLLRRTLEIGVLCNNAELGEKGGNAVGDPLEVALLEAGSEFGLRRPELLERMPEIREEPFDSETMLMATVHEREDGLWVAVKGAPEAVLNNCTRIAGEEKTVELTDDRQQDWLQRNSSLAEDGLRVVALAGRAIDSKSEEPYRDLVLYGLAGFWDPPSAEIPETLENCRQAGIRVIMVTGDHPATARAVSAAVGLTDESAAVLTGEDLDKIGSDDDSERGKFLETSIFARVSPEQKLNLVTLHQDNGAIVAMTGDGVNDAPALKKADIGVAMGERGTQVAREAADMILRDDKFATIVNAVYYGRTIFANIRKFIFFLISGNVSQILIVTLASLAAAPLPLLSLQILYLNLIGDVFPALALGVGKGDPAVMSQPPRDPHEPILPRGYWVAICGYAGIIAATVLCGFWFALHPLGLPVNEAVTVSFLSLSLARLTHVFNMRETRSAPIRNEITGNPYIWAAFVLCLLLLAAALYLPFLREVLGLVVPATKGWLIILAVGVTPLVVGLLVKSARGSMLLSGLMRHSGKEA